MAQDARRTAMAQKLFIVNIFDMDSCPGFPGG